MCGAYSLRLGLKIAYPSKSRHVDRNRRQNFLSGPGIVRDSLPDYWAEILGAGIAQVNEQEVGFRSRSQLLSSRTTLPDNEQGSTTAEGFPQPPARKNSFLVISNLD